ncbi:MAG: sigma-54-dependent Fis family transcriptional regulator, partial [Pseudoxanthomonas sp.]
MANVQQHVETILKVVHSGSPHAGLDANTDLIHRSWRRCVTEHALDPALRPDVRIETSTRLRECRQQHEEYLHVARAGMEQLYKHVSALGYVLLLTDSEGVTLDYIGNDTWDTPLKRAGLALGANWNEVHAGTNGIGTSIAEKTTLTCHRDDHFYIGHIGLSCTSTPLFDPHGGFLGALDISALTTPNARESQHLAQHLTVLYGRMIEDANFMHQFREHWILRLGTAGPLVDVCGELMLAVDRDGRILGANTDARRMLRLLESGRLNSDDRANIVGSHLTG